MNKDNPHPEAIMVQLKKDKVCEVCGKPITVIKDKYGIYLKDRYYHMRHFQQTRKNPDTRPTHRQSVEISRKMAKEREARIFRETEAKFAEEAVSTETISERETRRKAEAKSAALRQGKENPKLRAPHIYPTTCKRCGKEIYSSRQAVEHPLGRICSECTTPDEKQQILDYQAGHIMRRGRTNPEHDPRLFAVTEDSIRREEQDLERMIRGRDTDRGSAARWLQGDRIKKKRALIREMKKKTLRKNPGELLPKFCLYCGMEKSECAKVRKQIHEKCCYKCTHWSDKESGVWRRLYRLGIKNPGRTKPKWEKDLRSSLRYAYRNSSLNMLGKSDWHSLRPDEISKVLSYVMESYYPIRPYRPGEFDQISKDEFLAIFRDVFATEIRKMAGGHNPTNTSGLYESFHGVPPSKQTKVYYEPPPKRLIQIGELTQINYNPRNPSKKHGTEFYHKSGDDGKTILPNNLILATDEEGKNLYLVRKNKDTKRPYFSDRGIIG